MVWKWSREHFGEIFETKIDVIFVYVKSVIVESAKQAPEPPQQFRDGVHDLCEDCDAVKHAISRKSTN